MTNSQPAATNERPSPLMQFWGHVGTDSAYVRIQGSRLEWSLVGTEWVIQMAPMSSITAVTAEPGDDVSSLVVTTLVGSVEFLVQQETANEARTLLVQLVAAAAAHSPAATASRPMDSQVDELINLRWIFDASVVDEFGYGEAPARLLGF